MRDAQAPYTLYAMKKLLIQSTEHLELVNKEILLHQTISHPFVMPLVAHSITPSKTNKNATDVYLLFPYYSSGSIVDAVTKYNSKHEMEEQKRRQKDKQISHVKYPFYECEALRLFYAICNAVLALHKKGYLHRDIKPHNILLSYPFSAPSPPPSLPAPPLNVNSSFALASEPVPILIDLGSCTDLITHVTSRKQALEIQEVAAEHCTASYRAPELYDVKSECTLDETIDVWSLGCTLYYMAFGTSPFENDTEGVLTLSIRQGSFTIPNEYVEGTAGKNVPTDRIFSKGFIELIRGMLQADPEKRMSLKQAMSMCCELLTIAVERIDQEKTHEPAVPSTTASTLYGTPTEDIITSHAPAYTDSEYSSLFEHMIAGSYLTKFSASSHSTPHATLVTLSPDHIFISWKSRNKKPEACRIYIKDMVEIIEGAKSSTFQRYLTHPIYAKKQHLCFTIVCGNTSRSTLDLLAVDGFEQFRMWVWGLRRLMEISKEGNAT